MLKVELHAHTDLDPLDRVPHSSRDLIDRAAALGYHAVAITLHNRFYDPQPDVEYARERGIVLIPGIERSIDGRHVLLLNVPAACADVMSFDDIRALKRDTGGLVVAPHPFYPIAHALGPLLDRHADLFDAVEINSIYTPLLNFNRRAVRWARAHRKPLVGNTDLHFLDQMGTTFTLVDAPADATAICEAIRQGRTELRTSPLSMLRAGWIFGRMLAAGLRGRLPHGASQPPGAHDRTVSPRPKT